MNVQRSPIHTDPEILGGTPVFMGTRVPLRNLIDYLEHGHSLDEFLDSFPTVSREQAVAVLEATPKVPAHLVDEQRGILKREQPSVRRRR